MANKYARAGGGDWATDATWSTTDGGGADTVAPTASDVALLTSTSGAVTVNTTTCVCNVIDMRNYASTLTFTSGQKLSISGGTTSYLAGTLAGTGTLATLTTAVILNYSGAVSSSGVLLTSAIATTHVGPGDATFTWGKITQSSGNTVFNTDVYTVDAAVVSVWASGTKRLYVTRDLTGGSLIGASGTPIIVMAGTGTLGTTTLTLGIGVEIDTIGTITFGASVKPGTSAKTFTYIKGTVDTSACVFGVFAAYTLNTSGMTFAQVDFSGTANITLLSDFNATNINNNRGTLVFIGNFNVNCDTFISYANSTTRLKAGYTFTANHIYLNGNNVTESTFTSATGSSDAFVNYTGTEDGYRIVNTAMTDINFTSARKMYNWFGTNIRVTNCDVADADNTRLVMPQLAGV